MSALQKNLKVVVTGDVDSGKSTLIGRFLYEMNSLSGGIIDEIRDVCRRTGSEFEFGYLLDSLEEERRDQLTIDTTHVFCKTKRGKEFVFIDVPGHQKLLKNMLCGSSYADMAILVIDVQKSVEEQTKRHAFILKFLGIEQIIIVLNKMDLVGFNDTIFNKIKKEIIEFFKKLKLQPKYFIPISANQGENLIKTSKKMDWYKELTLIEALNSHFIKKENNGAFRLPIQDIYNINKEKIIVGRIISGEIKKGEKVNILPPNKEYKVKKIKVLNKEKSIACAPESIGLILDNMDTLKRGQVICKPTLPMISKEILAKIFCVHALNLNESLRFRCLTQESVAKISQIIGVWDIASLEPKSKGIVLNKTDFAEVVITIENPVVVEKFEKPNNLGRFVLQNEKEICAVGIIC